MNRIERAYKFGADRCWAPLDLGNCDTPKVWLVDQRNMRRPFLLAETARKKWLLHTAQGFEKRGLEKAAYKVRQEIREYSL